jgi:hypothetical protein
MESSESEYIGAVAVSLARPLLPLLLELVCSLFLLYSLTVFVHVVLALCSYSDY